MLQDNSNIIEFPGPTLTENEDQWVESMKQIISRAKPEQKAALLTALEDEKHIFKYSVTDLIEKDEDQKIEFKETFSSPSKLGKDGKTVKAEIIRYAALKEICGFLNSNDGVLLIGVADGKNTETKKPEIRGIEHDNFNGDKDKYSRTILDVVRAAFDDTAASLLSLSFVEINKKTVCRIDCKKSSEGVYCNFKNFGEKPFIRAGSSTYEPTQKSWIKWTEKNFHR